MGVNPFKGFTPSLFYVALFAAGDRLSDLRTR